MIQNSCKGELRLMQMFNHPHTQSLFGKDPGIVWSCDSAKINCPRGSGIVSNYILPQKALNSEYQEWDFTIHISKRPLTSILYLCLTPRSNVMCMCVISEKRGKNKGKLYTKECRLNKNTKNKKTPENIR